MPAAPQGDLPKPNATTEAEKAENRTEFIRKIVGIRPPKETAAKADEKVDDKVGEKPPEPKPGSKAGDTKVAAKKRAAAKSAPPVISTEDLATAVSTGVREALKPAEKPKTEEPKLTDKLSDKDKKRYSVFEQMEKNNPEANTGLAKRFLESRTKHEEYQKAWELKHTGKKFNIADEEHADFVSGNEVNWDEDEYVEALTDLNSSRAAKAIEEKYKSELTQTREQQERSERAREETPLVIQHQANTAKSLFSQLGEEFGKVLGENGAIDLEEIERLNKANPIYRRVVFPMAQKVEEFAGELMRVARGHTSLRENEPTRAEWEKMSGQQKHQYLLHNEIVNYVGAQERIFDKLDDDQKLNERGQTFTTSDKWEKMNADQRKKFWVLTDKELSLLYATDAAMAIKKSIEKEEADFRETAEKRGIKLPDAKKPEVKPADKPADEGAADVTGRRPPPSTVAPRMATKAGEQKDEKNATYKQILGRR